MRNTHFEKLADIAQSMEAKGAFAMLDSNPNSTNYEDGPTSILYT